MQQLQFADAASLLKLRLAEFLDGNDFDMTALPSLLQATRAASGLLDVDARTVENWKTAMIDTFNATLSRDPKLSKESGEGGSHTHSFDF